MSHNLDAGTLLVEGLRFPEGPTLGPDGSLYVSEIAGGTIRRVERDGSSSVFSSPGGGPNGMARGVDGCLYVANNGGIGWKDGKADPEAQKEQSRIERIGSDGSVTVLYTQCGDQPLMSASDMVVDRNGTLWFTDPGVGDIKEPRGRVYRAEPDGSSIREVSSGCQWPNGLALTPGGTHLVVAETGARAVFIYEVLDDRLGPRQKFGDLPKGYYPDGVCFDADGNLLVAGTFGGAVVVFDPDGQQIHFMELEDPLTTNVAFSGPDNDEALVTQARTGSVLRVKWSRPGLELPFESEAPW